MFDIQIDITIFIPLSNDNKLKSSQPFFVTIFLFQHAMLIQ